MCRSHVKDLVFSLLAFTWATDEVRLRSLFKSKQAGTHARKDPCADTGPCHGGVFLKKKKGQDLDLLDCVETAVTARMGSPLRSILLISIDEIQWLGTDRARLWKGPL
jgi:hypothetical protein